MKKTIEDVLLNQELYPSTKQWFGFGGDGEKNYENLQIFDEREKPSESFLNEELQKLLEAEPMRLLRGQRNPLLAETDWRASSDLTMSAEMTAYRQALRDLPSTATPSLDENGQLTGVEWPTVPE